MRTSWKINLAKILLFFVKLVNSKRIRYIQREGINFEIDIEEGIDLHLYLFRGFQKHIYSNKVVSLPDDAIIFDVGANAGIMSLAFANIAKSGFVFAFEPTGYAIDRFKKNMSLNKELSSRIKLVQTFVHATSTQSHDLQAYSSWRLTGNESRHQVHKGILKAAENVPSVTLDDFCRLENIKKLDFIKIDTDGFEMDVLKGAIEVIEKYHPQIIFEIGQYIMKEKNINFDDYFKLFAGLNYKIVTVKGIEIINSNYTKHIPAFGTVDLIATPKAL